MKVRVGFAAVAAITALAGAAFAADGYQFLIRGDATKVMLEQNMLNIATAEKIAQACVAEAKKEGVRVFAQGGGLPIVVNGNQLVGAIGVGGSPGRPGWNDEICAWRGLSQVMGKQPDL